MGLDLNVLRHLEMQIYILGGKDSEGNSEKITDQNFLYFLAKL